MTKKVKKVSAYLSLLLIPFGAVTVGLAGKATRTRQVDPASVSQQTDGAFRDGFYLGKLDARVGRKVRPSIGRWSDSKDRALFLAGYQRGYEEARAAKIAGQGH
jgi:hypothetical protein